MRVSSFLPFAALLVGLGGCAMLMSELAVRPSSPRPNVVVAPEKIPRALVLAEAIPQDFTTRGTGSVNEVRVRGWRTTLDAGFRNAFPDAAQPTGRKLELLQAELTFAPAAVGRGGTAAVVATIRFKARVVDAAGNELGAIAGTVRAREANTSPSEDGMTDNASKAVEALYETLVATLLAKT